MLSVSASGRAPTAVRLRHASATAWRPPSSGSAATVPRRAVGGQRQRRLMAVDPHHRGIGGTRALDRLAAHRAVVLVPNPGAGTQIRAGDQTFQRRGRAPRRSSIRAALSGSWFFVSVGRAVVQRGLVAQRGERNVGCDLSLVAHDDTAGVGKLADHREIQFPFVEDRRGDIPGGRGAGSSACAPGFPTA